MKVVVTGATGNAGTSLVNALAAEPAIEHILGLARRVPEDWRPVKTEWQSADVVWSDLEDLFTGADAVVHLAWAIQPSHDTSMLEGINLVGSHRVFDAVVRARVPKLVYASSIGVYGAGPRLGTVTEEFPIAPVPTSFYSRHKVGVEAMLDRLEEEHPGVNVVRLRPALIFKREAASGIRRLFAGPLLPSPLLRRRLLKTLPDIEGLRFQAVHADDVADAYRRALIGDINGSFNIAAGPPMTLPDVAEMFGASTFPLSERNAQRLVDLSWRAHLQPSGPGWLDMGLSVPLMDTNRAETELGWRPRVSAPDALWELIEGIRDGAGFPTPTLRPSSLRGRIQELRSGVGSRGPGQLADRRLLSYIADLHSIEEQALTQMKRAPAIAKESKLAAAFAQHEVETKGHEQMMRTRLRAHLSDPSVVKDVSGKAGGAAMLLFAASQPDSPGKLTAHAYSYEHMEIAAYRLLERIAAAAGDRATADAAHRILEQEIAMAERLAGHFDDAVDASLAGKSLEEMESSLDHYLDDVHAIETQAVVVLPAAERFVEDAVMTKEFSDRLEHVRRDRTSVEERIAERGSSRSAVKDAALAAGGLGIDGFFGVQPDRGLKIVGFIYAFEHLKVAAYELLARVAGRVGDAETQGLARRLSGDADLMAGRLEAWMGQAAVSLR